LLTATILIRYANVPQIYEVAIYRFGVFTPRLL